MLYLEWICLNVESFKKVIFFIFLFLFKVKENLAIYRQDVGSDGVRMSPENTTVIPNLNLNNLKEILPT